MRGLTREGGHWGDFIPKLQAVFPGDNIHPIDLPGAGIYHQNKSPANIPALTAHVRKVAQTNGWLDKPVNVLGVSLGGMVASDWLLTYPDEIRAGILINISIAGLSPLYQRLRWQSLPALLKVSMQTKMYDRELGIIQLISNVKQGYPALAEQWQRIQSEHPVSINNACAQLLAAARYRIPNQKPTVPVLLLNSAGDRLVSPLCTEAIGQHWQLPVITHPWAGHDLTTDDGDWVIKKIQKLKI